MLQLTRIIKWCALPALLMASMFSRFAVGYELLVDLVICLGSIGLVLRAAWFQEYFWVAGLVAIAIVFSPLLLVVKIFLLMGLTFIAMIATLLAAFRAQPMLVCIPDSP